MDTRGMGCCAVTEIRGLADHKTPEEAMRAFCKLWKDYNGGSGRMQDPGGHIIFTGVVQYDPTGKDPFTSLNGRKNDIEYGPNFAKFIKDNNLGSLRESLKRMNRRNHPTHGVKVWVWSPAVKTLKAWYRANYKTPEPVKEPVNG